jgi:hypothetical protein
MSFASTPVPRHLPPLEPDALHVASLIPSRKSHGFECLDYPAAFRPHAFIINWLDQLKRLRVIVDLPIPPHLVLLKNHVGLAVFVLGYIRSTHIYPAISGFITFDVPILFSRRLDLES